jgi:MarR family transcriptional regulator, transcriptional regulator for hemolysin
MPTRTTPEPSFGFLISDVARLIRSDFNRRVRSLGLTQAQWRAIAHLARDEGIKQATLAERLEVAPITLARLIDRLEDAGWVKRRADPEDRRLSLLFLTRKVQPILDEMGAHAEQAIAAALEGVEAQDRRALVRVLERMKQNLSAGDSATDDESRSRTSTDVAERRKARTGRSH